MVTLSPSAVWAKILIHCIAYNNIILYRLTADVIPSDWEQECQTSSNNNSKKRLCSVVY